MVVDRQTDRQKDRQTERQTDRQTDKVSYRGASLLKIKVFYVSILILNFYNFILYYLKDDIQIYVSKIKSFE